MDDLAPEIFRQRLLLEGRYRVLLDAPAVEAFLLDLAQALGLSPYGRAVVHAPGGQGKDINQGFDAFLPLVDSGISAYFWSGARFFSIVVYSCAPFDHGKALDFCREALETVGPLAWKKF